MAKVNKVFTQAACAVLPVPGTTPNNACLHVVGLLPAKVWLEANTRRAAIRLCSLDERYPLVQRMTATAPIRRRPQGQRMANRLKSRVRRMAERAPNYPRPVLLPRTWPPGPPDPPYPPKELAARLHRQWVTTVQADYVVYTDGSKYWVDGLKLTGWGFVAYHHGTVVHRQGGALLRAEVFNAEIYAVREAARWVAN